jgi:hypothetical protein
MAVRTRGQKKNQSRATEQPSLGLSSCIAPDCLNNERQPVFLGLAQEANQARVACHPSPSFSLHSSTFPPSPFLLFPADLPFLSIHPSIHPSQPRKATFRFNVHRPLAPAIHPPEDALGCESGRVSETKCRHLDPRCVFRYGDSSRDCINTSGLSALFIVISRLLTMTMELDDPIKMLKILEALQKGTNQPFLPTMPQWIRALTDAFLSIFHICFSNGSILLPSFLLFSFFLFC